MSWYHKLGGHRADVVAELQRRADSIRSTDPSRAGEIAALDAARSQVNAMPDALTVYTPEAVTTRQAMAFVELQGHVGSEGGSSKSSVELFAQAAEVPAT